jgi:hypothetical protein
VWYSFLPRGTRPKYEVVAAATAIEISRDDARDYIQILLLEKRLFANNVREGKSRPEVHLTRQGEPCQEGATLQAVEHEERALMSCSHHRISFAIFLRRANSFSAHGRASSRTCMASWACVHVEIGYTIPVVPLLFDDRSTSHVSLHIRSFLHL